MPQFGRPSTDDIIGEYTDEAGGVTNIWSHIDEVTAVDTDYIRSAAHNAGFGAAAYTTKLTSVTDPVSSTGHIMRFRYSTDLDNQEPVDFGLDLRQGNAPGTIIASHPGVANVVSSTWTTAADYTLSAAEADAITNYADLFYRFTLTWT